MANDREIDCCETSEVHEELLKIVLKKVRGTDIELLLKESGLIQ